MPTDLEKLDAQKCPCSHPHPASALTARLKIGESPDVWTSVNIGEHSMLQIRHFWRVENSIFARDRRDHEARITRKISSVEQGIWSVELSKILVNLFLAALEIHINDTPERQ